MGRQSSKGNIREGSREGKTFRVDFGGEILKKTYKNGKMKLQFNYFFQSMITQICCMT